MSYLLFTLPQKTCMGTPGCVCHLTGVQDVASCIQSSNRDVSFLSVFFFFLYQETIRLTHSVIQLTCYCLQAVLIQVGLLKVLK